MRDRREPVLIDTSAWVDAFRGLTPTISDTVENLLLNDMAVTCGPVIFEIRRGLREHERTRVLPLMEALHRLPFHEDDWAQAGELDARLRQDGLTVPPTDALIAHLCLRYDLPLLTLDSHFDNVPGLRLVR
jgi:predicted nucleic acid-binding protein